MKKVKNAKFVMKVKKKTQRNIGWGLRQFSMLVCKKVEAKGRTTYNEVADEIIAELAPLQKSASSYVQFEEKNIRRRVYDAFNVLMAIDAIVKDKKEIRWVGWSCTKSAELKRVKEVHMNLMNSIQRKARFLKELEDQFVDHQNLMLRNQRLHKSANMSSQGVALPFLLVRTSPKATVEIEISEDQQFVKFDFNGTPFNSHDGAAILKEMRCSRALETENATRGSMDGSNSIADLSGK
ncbi:transcription factor-like protein DPB isoform X3 [Phoenix dactylifera]|uniref:Transcription factor-like protein DPB isoform X3 n=1 Tax=Phoenix dactylifera TaxID=42345 RepID=A0A8B7C796_PHODC|nr:transcription factor-like protein DPB isoform X3 [Phoenix dactylifera]XP_008793117.2 transcription factor-like protein DPB isoform X3 [Phoenix dactylifera]XP_038987561.1 transcription factor-like protein DPB isoform X3 [Phoenix dactylifera]XP_038987562.1 transcription factor-like protein DPB isoform X3 [Phoenix dactylifera]